MCAPGARQLMGKTGAGRCQTRGRRASCCVAGAGATHRHPPHLRSCCSCEGRQASWRRTVGLARPWPPTDCRTSRRRQPIVRLCCSPGLPTALQTFCWPSWAIWERHPGLSGKGVLCSACSCWAPAAACRATVSAQHLSQSPGVSPTTSNMQATLSVRCQAAQTVKASPTQRIVAAVPRILAGGLAAVMLSAGAANAATVKLVRSAGRGGMAWVPLCTLAAWPIAPADPSPSTCHPAGR